MNKFKATLATLLLPFVFFAALFAFLTAAPPPVHAFAGDYALEFDGSTNYVALPAASDVIGLDWQTTKTVSVWVRPTGTAPSAGSGDTGDLIVGDHPRWFGINRANVSGTGDRLWVWNATRTDPSPSGVSVFARIPIEYQPGEWVHITLVHDNTILQAYKNGVLVGTATTGITAWGHPGGIGGIDLRIGGQINQNYNNSFQGQIDEVRMWNTALTGEEIHANMYRSLIGNEAGLAAYYKMSDGSGTTLTDNTNIGCGTPGDGCEGTLIGDPLWVTSGAFAGPRNALAFDGVDDVVALNANTAIVIGGNWASAKTAELWAYPTGSAPTAVSAAGGSILLGNASWGIARAIIGGEDRLWLFNNDNDGEDRLGLPYAADAWNHLALVHSGGLLSAYQNGALLGSIGSGDTAVDSNLVIGQGFTGRLDEARLWSTARTAVQIQDNMARTLAHNEGGLAAYYRFDQENDGTVTTVYDTAVNSRHAAMTNMNPATAWVASTAFNTWIGSESSNWADGANWSRYAAPIASDNVGLTNYSASNGPSLESTATVNNLSLVGGASLTVAGAGTLINNGLWAENGTLANNGRIQQTQPVPANATVDFFGNGSYGGLTITSADNLADVTAVIIGNTDCTNPSSGTVLRCFNITADNPPINRATVTFDFKASELNGSTCADVRVYHYIGGTWVPETLAAAPQCTVEPYSVTVNNITTFSPFVLTSGDEPTAVSLQTFSVASTPGVALLLLIGSVFMLLTAVVVYGRRAD